jgi:hypothetical protein
MVMNEWLCNIDKGLINGRLLFLDLKKAFDTVNHDILFEKLKLYGFQKQSLPWFESYLKDRKQFIVKLIKVSHQSGTFDLGYLKDQILANSYF